MKIILYDRKEQSKREVSVRDLLTGATNQITVSDCGTGVWVLELPQDIGDTASFSAGTLAITDGVTAPDTISGKTILFVDTSDGDLKVKFGDGTVKTISVDT